MDRSGFEGHGFKDQGHSNGGGIPIDDSKSTVIDSFCLPHISSGFVFSSVFYVILYTAVKAYYHVYTE